MVAGIPGWNEIAILGTLVLFYGAVAAGAIGLLRWIVDRRTRELRQRVALLEHKVTEIEAAADDDSLDGAE
ncbi:hypothetical protein OB920_11990 [Halobacteria archaeon HArc-gm2]|nr:hypothetical protein [Halobacteria archaeon HArc-gm2]